MLDRRDLADEGVDRLAGPSAERAGHPAHPFIRLFRIPVRRRRCSSGRRRRAERVVVHITSNGRARVLEPLDDHPPAGARPATASMARSHPGRLRGDRHVPTFVQLDRAARRLRPRALRRRSLRGRAELGEPLEARAPRPPSSTPRRPDAPRLRSPLSSAPLASRRWSLRLDDTSSRRPIARGRQAPALSR